jgi:hypothetical protein
VSDRQKDKDGREINDGKSADLIGVVDHAFTHHLLMSCSSAPVAQYD